MEQQILYPVGGFLLGLAVKSLWKKSPLETDYMTEERCKQCRDECRQVRVAERNDLREEMRLLGKSVDELRRTIIDLLRGK